MHIDFRESFAFSEVLSLRPFAPVRAVYLQWNDTDRSEQRCGDEQTVPLHIFPPQISHGLSWDRNRASQEMGRGLTDFFLKK